MKEQPSSKVKCERNISNITAGLALENEVTFPAQLFASYVLGGWSRTANNKEALRELIKTGLDISPVSEILARW